MVLKNYYKLIALGLITSGVAVMNAVTVTGATGKTMRASTSNTSDLQFAMAGAQRSQIAGITNSTGLAQSGIHFGTGTTPPTMDDYKLSGDRISSSGISVTSSYSTTPGDTNCTGTATYTIVNNSGADITIGEIGLVVFNYNNYYLIERTALDEPVTIPTGGVGQVKHTISMDYPTA